MTREDGLYVRERKVAMLMQIISKVRVTLAEHRDVREGVVTVRVESLALWFERNRGLARATFLRYLDLLVKTGDLASGMGSSGERVVWIPQDRPEGAGKITAEVVPRGTQSTL